MKQEFIILKDKELKHAYEHERERLRKKTVSELYRKALKEGLVRIKKIKEKTFATN